MHAFSYEVPGNEVMYQRVKQEVGAMPDGLIVHLVTRTPGGLRHTNVWRSQQEWESYRDETVRPAVTKMLEAQGITDAPQPREEEMPLVDLFARENFSIPA